MAIPQEVLDYTHNRVELKIHKIQITLRAPMSSCSPHGTVFSAATVAIRRPAPDNPYRLYFSHMPHVSTRSLFKRTLDILGALVGLAILGVLFVPVAIAIRLDSAGPIFYSQERFGLQGHPFAFGNFALWSATPMS